jgi:hypothetical protein
MSSSSTATVGVGIGLAVGAAASAATALWCSAPAAAADRRAAAERPESSAASRSELLGLRPSALRRRALELGVLAVDIDDAEDAGGKDGLVALVQAAAQSRAARDLQDGGAGTGGGAGHAVPETPASLRAELARMQLGELNKRARGEGVEPETIEAALDSADPRSSLVQLLLDRQAPPEASGRDPLSALDYGRRVSSRSC